MRLIPTPVLTSIVVALSAALAIAAAALGPVTWGIAGMAAILLAIPCVADVLWTRIAWHAAQPVVRRRLPATFAVGTSQPIVLEVSTQSASHWQVQIFDHADSSLLVVGQPQTLTLLPQKVAVSRYEVLPTRRGDVTFAASELRIRSRLHLFDLVDRVGVTQVGRVFPDFSQVARYAWLASSSRLAEMGVRKRRRRGEGTDFHQLAEYRTSDSLRHIDWKATQRYGKPVVRQYQDERDQRVILLIDCGRRMRADDRTGEIGTSHFDQVLNAVMILSYVALRHGDAVGAMTYGTPQGEERYFAPAKGIATYDALMEVLYDVQPTPIHSDLLTGARDLLKRERKRALVIVITNFRDEDAPETSAALALLRSRHLVMLASLRERVVGEMISMPLDAEDAIVGTVSALRHEQSRFDAFRRIGSQGSLMVDAEPDRLGVALVNRYYSAKRAGL